MKNHTAILSSSSKLDSSNHLFENRMLRWQALTGAERFVCIAIVLVPVWWIVSWNYSPLLMAIGLFIHRLWKYKNLGLRRPSLPVIALLCLTAYMTILYKIIVPDGPPSGLIGSAQMWGAGGLLLWYVQSHQIRVRLQVIAWAFSIVVLQAVSLWLIAHFILSEPYFTPPRTLMAMLLDKGETFSSSKLGAVGNYLVPYYLDTKGSGGLVRYTFFFPHSTVSAFVFGFVLLTALDLKNRVWSRWLIGASSFLIFICQSRNAWVSLPIVVLIHWLFTTGKTKGLAFLLALFALITFVTLSVPTITEQLTSQVMGTVEATGDLRKSSTEDRTKIYLRTLASIIEEPPVIGHVVPGAEVTPGYEFARIGTESFILGSMLYKAGFLGTGIFLTFLIPFLSWLYQTRKHRPACCFLMLLLLGIMAFATEFAPTEVFTVLLCVIATDFKPESVAEY